MEHAGGEMMLGIESPSSKDFLLSTVNFSSNQEGKLNSGSHLPMKLK